MKHKQISVGHGGTFEALGKLRQKECNKDQCGPTNATVSDSISKNRKLKNKVKGNKENHSVILHEGKTSKA